MSNWKMPDEIAEIYTEIIGADLFDRGYYEIMYSQSHKEIKNEMHFLFDLINHGLVLTPSERDAQQKRIAKLEAEVEELKKEIDGMLWR